MVDATVTPTQGRIIILKIDNCLIVILAVQRHAQAFDPAAIPVRSAVLKEMLGLDDQISIAVTGAVVITSPCIAAPAAALTSYNSPPPLPSCLPSLSQSFSPNSVMCQLCNDMAVDGGRWQRQWQRMTGGRDYPFRGKPPKAQHSLLWTN
jgi:hypothetical protein